jgi:AAA family ATPase
VTAHTVLDVPYEGRMRRFAFHAAASAADGLAAHMGALTLDATATRTVWTVGWDTQVVLDTPHTKPDAPVGPPHIPHARHSRTTQTGVSALPPADAYASVGGLAPQVQLVRDLLDIPLTRPELFAHYGPPSRLRARSC